MSTNGRSGKTASGKRDTSATELTIIKSPSWSRLKPTRKSPPPDTRNVRQSTLDQRRHTHQAVQPPNNGQTDSPKKVVPAPWHIVENISPLEPPNSDTSKSNTTSDSEETINVESDHSDSSESSNIEVSDLSFPPIQIITMACKSTLTPEPFYGKADEDALSFIDRFNCYVTFHGLTEEKQKASFPLLLKDTAFTWYMALPDATKTGDMKDIIAEFKDRFGPESLLEWAQVTDIFSKKQTKTQRVQDYITYMQREATKVKLPDKQTVQAIISGLLPPIRQYVVQNDPQTMEDLLKHAKIGEASQGLQEKETETQSTAVLTAIADLQAQMKDISLQQKAATSAVAALMPREQQSRSRSPFRSNERRVRFDDRDQPQYRSASRDRFRKTAPTYNKPTGRQIYNHYGFNCTSCGSNRHTKQRCFYRNYTCNFCQKVGHIHRACFQAQKARKF